MGRGPFNFWFSLSIALYLIVPVSLTLSAENSAAGSEAISSMTPSGPEYFEKSQTKRTFGKKMGYTLKMTPDTEDTGLITDLVTKLLGQDVSVLSAAAKSTNLLEGETELTIAGLKVWNDKGEFKNGSYIYSGGIPTTQTRLKLVAIPVGPVTVQVDAGLAYDAYVEANLQPQISVPVQFTTLKAKLSVHADVAGFLEGYAQFLFLRGGVGGEIDILSGRASVDANLGINVQNRNIAYSGYLETLGGKLYAFADIFKLFSGRWKRIWEPAIKNWNGFCFQLSPDHPDPEAPCGN